SFTTWPSTNSRASSTAGVSCAASASRLMQQGKAHSPPFSRMKRSTASATSIMRAPGFTSEAPYSRARPARFPALRYFSMASASTGFDLRRANRALAQNLCLIARGVHDGVEPAAARARVHDEPRLGAREVARAPRVGRVEVRRREGPEVAREAPREVDAGRAHGDEVRARGHLVGDPRARPQEQRQRARP